MLSLSLILSTVFSTFLYSLVVLAKPGRADFRMPVDHLPSYHINLDLPADQRWHKAIDNYCQYVSPLNDYFDHLTTHLSPIVVTLMEQVAAQLVHWVEIPIDYRQEMMAFSDQCHFPHSKLVLLNYIYELRYLGPETVITDTKNLNHTHQSDYQQFDARVSGACTSTVIENDQHLYLARNMDWNLPNHLRNLTFHCHFYRGVKYLYSGVCFPGFVGQMTAMKRDHFAVTANERLLGGEPWWNIWYGLTHGGWAPSHLLRQVMETANNYQEAVILLSEQQLTSPVYYTIVGCHSLEGQVLTRGRDQLVVSRHLHQNNSQPGEGWYLLQTNYDWDRPAPVKDNRRAYALKYLQEIGKPTNATVDHVWNVLNRWPVKNMNTMYTTIMSPAQNYFRTVRQYDR